MPEPLTLPCLRGQFGDWVYYTALMPMSEVVERIHFAREIHDSVELSDMIQRSLEGERASRIAGYLKTNDERFFNSLVLATYDGKPGWFEIGNLKSTKNSEILKGMPASATDTLGLLQLSGDESIFALDGQHRLAGMRLALRQEKALAKELVPLILVAHDTGEAGQIRTRRLFTTLNKTAIPVKKMDIIALDEDDVMAIVARSLVEKEAEFKHPRILVASSESMPAANRESLLTIAALYDILKLLFRYRTGQSDYELRFNRPSDDELDKSHRYALAFFRAFGRTFPPVGQFLRASDPATVVSRYRTDAGGHVLFRTIGMDIFVQAALGIAKRDGVAPGTAVAGLSALPTDLGVPPFANVIWNTGRGVVKPANKTLARRLVFHMLNLQVSDRQRETLLGDYRAALGFERDDPKVKLPKRI